MPLHNKTSLAYAFRQMGPEEMVLWEQRRKHPVRFIGNFVLVMVAFGIVSSFVFSAFQPGLSQGLGVYFAFAIVSSICSAIGWGLLGLLTGVIFYSSGVSKFKQAWSKGVRPYQVEAEQQQSGK